MPEQQPLFPRFGNDGELNSLLLSMVKDYAIFATDMEGRIVSWNEGARRVYGYSTDEILNQHIGILFESPKDDPGETAQIADSEKIANYITMILQHARNEGTHEEQTWQRKKDGTALWADLTISPLLAGNGQLLGYVQVARDQTKRRVEQERLAMFKLLVSVVTDYAIFLLDTEGNVLTWNEGAQRIKGYRADEIIGQHFSKFYTQEDIDSGKPKRELEIAVRTGKYEEEGWRLRKDGSQFWANVIITALFDEKHRLIGFGKVTRDLTERKRTEDKLEDNARELERARDQAMQASTLKSQFVANVSHEIRTPMSGLLGMAELLKYEGLPESARELAEHIFSSAQNLLDILNDLLDFSKIEAGKMTIDNRPMDPRQIVQNVVRTTAVAAQQKGIRLEAHIDPELPERTVGDQMRVQQILMNFVSNALKFTTDGRIDIYADNKGKDASGRQCIRFTVADTGIGIPPEKQTILFQPFVQADGTTTRKFGGTGLGLSISKRLSDLMSGEIGLESAEGKGSRFWFEVPMALPEPEHDFKHEGENKKRNAA